MEMLRSLIKRHEGLRLKPYECSAGKLTIGYGRNLEEGISASEAEVLLDNDLRKVFKELDAVFGQLYLSVITEGRFNALGDMMFNLGRGRFLGFKKMIQALRGFDWNKAADEMLDSKWAKQVGRRAEELAKLMREG